MSPRPLVILVASVAIGLVVAALLAHRSAKRPPAIIEAEPVVSDAPSPQLAIKSEVAIASYRLMSLRTMDRPLRLLALFAIGLLVLAAVMVGSRGLPTPSVGVLTPTDSGGAVSTIPTQFLVLSILLEAVAFSYLIAGLLLTSLPVRLAGLVIITAAGIIDSFYGSRLIGGLAGVLLLAGIWAIGLLVSIRDRKKPPGGDPATHEIQRKKVSVVLAILALVVAADAFGAWHAGAPLFGSEFAILLAGLAYLTTPMFIRAGSDFGDVGNFGSYHLGRLIAKWRPAFVTMTAILVAAAILVLAINAAGSLVAGVGLGSLFLAFSLATMMIVRSRNVADPRVPSPFVVVASVAFFIVFNVLAVTANLQPKSTAANAVAPRPPASLLPYRYTGTPPFSIQVPTGWKGTVVAEPPNSYLKVVFIGRQDSEWGLFVVALAAGKYPPQEAWRVPFGFNQSLVAGPPIQDGEWLAVPLNTTTDRGVVWVRTANGRQWLLYFVVFAADRFDANLPQLKTVRDSWSPYATASPVATGAGPSGPAALERLIGRAAAIWLVASLASVAILFLWRRRLSPVLVVGFVYLALTGMWFFLTQLNAAAAVVGIASNSTAPHLGLSTLQATIALATLLVIAVKATQRRLRDAAPLVAHLLVLSCVLQLLASSFDIYTTPLKAANAWVADAQVVLILLALLADVALSGEAITNRGGRNLPRNARVLLFLGYILLVAAALVFYSNLTLPTGTAIESIVDSESATGIGIGVLSVPLVLTIFLFVTTRRVGRSARAGSEAVSFSPIS